MSWNNMRRKFEKLKWINNVFTINFVFIYLIIDVIFFFFVIRKFLEQLNYSTIKFVKHWIFFRCFINQFDFVFFFVFFFFFENVLIMFFKNIEQFTCFAIIDEKKLIWNILFIIVLNIFVNKNVVLFHIFNVQLLNVINDQQMFFIIKTLITY